MKLMNLAATARVAMGLLALESSQGMLHAEPGKFTVMMRAAPRPTEDPGVEFQAERMGLACATKVLVGKKLQDDHGKPVGKLQDLVFDLESGKVLAGLVSVSGDLHLIPAASFGTEFMGNLGLKTSRQAVEAGPKVTLKSMCETAAIESAYAQYHCTLPRIRAARSIAQCLKKPVTSKAGEPIGKVSEIVSDLEAGRIIYVVIAPSVGPSPEDKLYVAPGRAFGWREDGSLILKASQQQFLASRSIPKQFPTEMAMPELAIAIYKHYPAELSSSATVGGETAGQAHLQALPITN